MKKFITLIMAVMMAFSMVACGSDKAEETTTATDESASEDNSTEEVSE